MWKTIRLFGELSLKIGVVSTAAFCLLLFYGSFCCASQCSEPPFVSASMVSNVLLILDNSASMYDLAYICENEAQGKPKCKKKESDIDNFICQPTLCYDDSYDSPYDTYVATGFLGKTYYGNYEPEKWYKYGAGYFEECEADVNPAQKACLNKQQSRQDYCVVSLDTPEVYFRGNALNWMSTSKLDIEKKVLTGGKYEDSVGESVLITGESRGCIGKSFLKQIRCWVPDKKKNSLEGSNFVFAINGPSNDEIGSFSSGGQTSIEIYQVDDNFDCQMDDCLNAVTCFSTTDAGPFGQCKQYIKGCLYDFEETDNPDKESKSSMSAFVHSLLTCRDLARNDGDDIAFLNEGDVNSIQSICKGLYHYQKGKTGSIQWGELSDYLNPSLICSKYPYDPSDPEHSNISTISNEDKIGIGWCYTGDGNTHSWADPYNLDSDPIIPPATQPDISDEQDCIKTQLVRFCTLDGTSIIPINNPLDPSNLLLLETTPEYFYIPAMLIAAGKDALLKSDDGEEALTLINKKFNQEVPQGLLHRVKSKVRLGLLASNPRGSALEFTTSDYSTYGYQSTQDLDGGVVLSPVAPDNAGVIEAVNSQPATSNWTPVGETFYEATRYFRGMSSAYNASTQYTSPVEDYCQSNNVILISDSYSTMDKNLPGTHFGAANILTGGGETETFSASNFFRTYTAEGHTHTVDFDKDFGGTLPFHGTTYAAAVAHWGHTYNGKWNASSSGDENDKNLNFYSIYALGGTPPENNLNLLWQIAKYGGFVDSDDDNFPDNSEWDGHNYVEANDAYQLESALTNIFYEIAAVGAAGAVATVTQEMETDDLLVRGGFETNDPETSNIDWKGHLEVYIPYEGCSEFTDQASCEGVAGCSWVTNSCTGSMYIFQKSSHWGSFCSSSDVANGYCWDAGRSMPTHGSRNIFTFIGGSQTLFNQTNTSTLQPYLKNDIDFQNLNCSSKTQATCAATTGCWWDLTECKPTATYLINWIRGDTTYDGTTARDRNGWILGDVVYSTPVVVGTPSLASVDPSLIGTECSNFTSCKSLSQTDCSSSAYCTWDSASSTCNVNLSSPNTSKCFYTYREANLNRKKMVYAGANDGMLHAFVVGKYDSSNSTWLYKPSDDSEIGTELWAYIPSNFLSELKELARLSYGTDIGCKHRFLVDLSSQAWDVFIDHNNDGSKEWRTIILGGERGGGDVYFAIDVTDPNTPLVLWEYSPIRNLLKLDESGMSYAFSYTYDDYMKIKAMPTSWSMPYAGRLNISSSVNFAVNTVSPLNSSTPAVGSYTQQTASDRWFAFVGGGCRVYDSSYDPSTLVTGDEIDLEALQKPNLFVIDIETGDNILQYVWPKIQHAYSSQWPEQSVGDHNIPYAMANTAAYDLWGLNAQGARCTNPDGAVDHVFVGDLSGLLWGLRIDPASPFGLQLDLWETKGVTGGAYGYRGARQPLTVTPVGALDGLQGATSLNLHIYYGTGKFDDIEGAENDKNDSAIMSFYGLSIPLSSFNALGTPASFSVGATSFNTRLNRHGCASSCTGTTDDWVTVAGQDCCYECLLDFVATGERVVDSALVASEMVFFTTFIPDTDSECSAGGDAYLYAVDYLCRSLSMDPFSESGLSYSWLGESTWTTGSLPGGQQAKVFRARVGTGMPSRPILDSSGEYIFVQTSDARIHKIKVNLPGNPLQVKGWKEEN